MSRRRNADRRPGQKVTAGRFQNKDRLHPITDRKPGTVMANFTAAELKAFVPARDFALSKRFYQDLGFVLAESDERSCLLFSLRPCQFSAVKLLP